MLQISEIVRKTEEMFDLFNKHFYEGELNRPAITVSPDGGRGAYGWCSINEIWNASGEYGTPAARSIGKSISAPSTLTGPSSSWQPRFCMRWRISTIWFMASKT